MDYEMDSLEQGSSLGHEMTDPSVELDWQVDSEWINLTTPPGSKSKGRATIPQNFHFIPTSQGGKFLVIDNQTLRLTRKSQSGHSYWVCSMPCCNARCILDPSEKQILRYSGDHNHSGDVSRTEYKHFINSLKMAVKENPNVKPKTVYDAQVERARELRNISGLHEGQSSDVQLNLPSFDAVRTAIYNTRNALLSSKSSDGHSDEKQHGTPSKSKRSNPRRKSTPSKSSSTSGPADLDELNLVLKLK